MGAVLDQPFSHKVQQHTVVINEFLGRIDYSVSLVAFGVTQELRIDIMRIIAQFHNMASRKRFSR